MSHTVTLHTWPQASEVLAKAAAWIKRRAEAGKPVKLTLEEERRTSPQNRHMWAALSDVSRQVDWYGQRLTPEDWKHVFSAALYKQRSVPGIDGGFVVLGMPTSKMSVSQMGDLLTLILAFGAERGIVWSKDAQ